jgi:phosphopantothenoylcysteine decarboxylase/phosphopantothenate--cysteine ligase
MLQGKKILLGVTGSIAAYKAANLTRLLVKAGAEVKVIMTPAAVSFISPLTLATLSRNPVLIDLFENDTWSNHVMLGRWADVMIIAPATCNTLSKMSNGLCDNLLLAVYLSATCPVLAAPAMDEDMWKHPSTKINLDKLAGFGNEILPVDNGDLASGLVGDGRMAEPEAIVDFLKQYFGTGDRLKGKKILITAGPTYEPIDPVRFIGNRSSGKMGIAIAEGLKKRGAAVTLVIGPTAQKLPAGMEIINVNTASEMYNAAMAVFPAVEIAVLCAAVADYSIAEPASEKIKKGDQQITLTLEKTKDILRSIGEIKKDSQIVVGFALETDDEVNNALKKLNSKNADLIVLNSLQDKGAGFGHDTNKVTIFGKDGGVHQFNTASKTQVAEDIINTILNYKNA